MSDDRKLNGLIESPNGMLGHLTPKGTRMDQFVADELARRAEYDSRPDVVQKRIRMQRSGCGWQSSRQNGKRAASMARPIRGKAGRR